MAFERRNLGRTSSSYNTQAPSEYTYISDVDAKAVIQAADYFIEGGANRDALSYLKPGDWIKAVATDGPTILVVDVVDPVTPTLTTTVVI